MQRFYINSELVWENIFLLEDKEIIHQLSKVLRIKLNDEIVLFNGEENNDFLYKIIEINKKTLSLELIKTIKKDSEINFKLSLYQSMPNKLDKIESIVQKATEVGFTSFNLFRSDRSQKIILSDKKIERLNKIIIEACEQSWRNKIPKLNILSSLSFWTWFRISWENIFFHTSWKKSVHIKDLKIKNKEIINLYVWPEGWWSEDEIKNFEQLNFQKIYLWNRIMRTETVWNIVWFWIINN